MNVRKNSQYCNEMNNIFLFSQYLFSFSGEKCEAGSE